MVRVGAYFCATWNERRIAQIAADKEQPYRLSLVEKEELCFKGLDLQQWEEHWRQLRSSLLNQRRLLDIGFPHFCLLPVELRTQIWLYAIAHLPTRLHIITKKDGRFVSNQETPALIWACSESRSIYLQSGVKAAYGTYVHFDTDIIYIRPFANSEGRGPWFIDLNGERDRYFATFEAIEPLVQISQAQYRAIQMSGHDVDDEEPDLELTPAEYITDAWMSFQFFLDDPSAREIKHLAMTVDFLHNNPLDLKARGTPDHVSMEQATLRTMRKMMPAWKKR